MRNFRRLASVSAILNPFFIALYPVIFLYARNFEEVFFSSFLLVAITVLLFSGLVFGVVLVTVRDLGKSSLLAVVSLGVFFFYGHLVNIIPSFQLFSIGTFIFGKNHVLMLSVLFSLIILFIAVLKTKITFNGVNQTIGIVLIMLIIINCFPIISSVFGYKKTISSSKENNNLALEVDKSFLPDIYYIILDAYARNDVLEEIYGYQDKILLPYLKDKGFYIAENSHTNYFQTYLSLASSLNMNYLDNLGLKSPSFSQLTKLIDKNLVALKLRDIGYQYITFNSGINASKRSSIADVFYDYGFPTGQFGLLFFDSTLLGYTRRKLNLDLYIFHRSRILSILTTLKHIPENNLPTFTFAHIVSPHPPFIFDENGNDAGKGLKFSFDDGAKFPGTQEEYKKFYIEQLEFISRETVKVVDIILKKSKKPPIIIIQSDHGPASQIDWKNKAKLAKLKTFKGKVYDPRNPVSIKERTSILNAYFLPKGGAEFLYSSISPVNSFRIIFNFYFDANLDLLPDEVVDMEKNS